jgi:septum formation protein
MIDQRHPLLLGSGSPRRREILGSVGLPLVTRPVHVDETPLAGEGAAAYLARVVGHKLAALAESGQLREVGALLVADTVVLCDGTILGKPNDDEEARAMLRRLAGRGHVVSTRFAVSAPTAPAQALAAETVDTEVWFRPLGEAHIRRYVATGEGRDKAGAYAIQGIGGFAVARIAGSYSNVVGLPACEVVAALERAGLLGDFPMACVLEDQAGR